MSDESQHPTAAAPEAVASEDAEKEQESRPDGLTIPSELPVLPLKDTVIYPLMSVPLVVGRPASRRLVDAVVLGLDLGGIVGVDDADGVEDLDDEILEELYVVFPGVALGEDRPDDGDGGQEEEDRGWKRNHYTGCESTLFAIRPDEEDDEKDE